VLCHCLLMSLKTIYCVYVFFHPSHSLSSPPLLYARSLNEACVVVAGPLIKYINESIHCLSGFGTKMLEPTRPLSTSTEEFAIERFGEIMSGSNHKCKCLKVIFVWAEYYFLIPFLSLVNVRNKSRFDPSALRLSIPRTKFKEFCTALVSLIVFRESSIEIK